MFFDYKSVRASSDKAKIEEMTKECVQKYSWDLLEKFVENLVTSIFTTKFEEKAREQIPNWLGLASSHEVTRNLGELLNLLPDSSDDIQLYSDQFMFGSTPIDDALNLASLRFQDKAWKDYRKVLVVISDGEFDTNRPLEVTNMLKEVGVNIVSCCLTSNDIMTKLVRYSQSTWPDGARKMLEMASISNEHDEILQNLTENRIKVPDGVKLFYQINQSDLLEDVFENLFDE